MYTQVVVRKKWCPHFCEFYCVDFNMFLGLPCLLCCHYNTVRLYILNYRMTSPSKTSLADPFPATAAVTPSIKKPSVCWAQAPS